MHADESPTHTTESAEPNAASPALPRRDESLPHVSRTLAALLRPLHFVFMPAFFQLRVLHPERVPAHGPVIITPVHRSRWDPMLIPCLTRRLIRSMASHDEFIGVQGWFMRTLGAFPVNTRRPTPGTLKICAEVLRRGEPLVIYPEGSIFYYPPDQVHPLRPGTAWLALKVQRELTDQPIQIVPVRIRYSQLRPKFRSSAEIEARPAIPVPAYLDLPEKQAIAQLTLAIQSGMGDVVNGSLAEMITPRDQQPAPKRSYGRRG